MKHALRNCGLGLWLLIFGLVISGAAQQPNGPPPISTSLLNLPLITSLPPVTQANLGLVGNPGNSTYYYWLVTNYTFGQTSPQGPFIITNGPTILSVSQYVTITPSYLLGGTVDILKTTSATPPTGTGNYALSTGNVSGTIADQGGSLASYTVAPASPDNYGLCLSNKVAGLASAHLILGQGSGCTFVADLSAIGTSTGTVTSITGSGPIVVSPSPLTTTGVISLATSGVTAGSYTATNLTVNSFGLITAASNGSGSGGVTGSGTAGVLPEWLSGGTSIGNSPLDDTGTVLQSSEALQISLSSAADVFKGTSTPASGSLNCNGSGGTFLNPPVCRDADFSISIPGAGMTTSSVGAAVYGSLNTTALSNSPALAGLYGVANQTGNGSPAYLAGVVGVGNGTAGFSGTISNLSGVTGLAVIGGLETALVMAGVDGQIQFSGAGSQTFGAALYARSPSVSAPVSNIYGLYIADQTTGGGTNNPSPHGIYEAGTAPNILNGSLTMGAGTTITLPMTGTTCLEQVSGVITSTGSACGSGGGGTTVSVNGSTVSNPNFNGSTPAAGANGLNVTWQVSGSSVSGEIVGNGNANTYLNGTGAYTTPSGAGTVTSSGPPTADQWPYFTTATNIAGITVPVGETVAGNGSTAAPTVISLPLKTPAYTAGADVGADINFMAASTVSGLTGVPADATGSSSTANTTAHSMFPQPSTGVNGFRIDLPEGKITTSVPQKIEGSTEIVRGLGRGSTNGTGGTDIVASASYPVGIGSGGGVTCTAVSGGACTGYTTTPGSGYYYNPVVVFSGGGCTLVPAKVLQIVDGAIAGVANAQNGIAPPSPDGSGCSSTPTATIYSSPQSIGNYNARTGQGGLFSPSVVSVGSYTTGYTQGTQLENFGADCGAKGTPTTLGASDYLTGMSFQGTEEQSIFRGLKATNCGIAGFDVGGFGTQVINAAPLQDIEATWPSGTQCPVPGTSYQGTPFTTSNAVSAFSSSAAGVVTVTLTSNVSQITQGQAITVTGVPNGPNGEIYSTASNSSGVAISNLGATYEIITPTCINCNTFAYQINATGSTNTVSTGLSSIVITPWPVMVRVNSVAQVWGGISHATASACSTNVFPVSTEVAGYGGVYNENHNERALSGITVGDINFATGQTYFNISNNSNISTGILVSNQNPVTDQVFINVGSAGGSTSPVNILYDQVPGNILTYAQQSWLTMYVKDHSGTALGVFAIVDPTAANGNTFQNGIDVFNGVLGFYHNSTTPNLTLNASTGNITATSANIIGCGSGTYIKADGTGCGTPGGGSGPGTGTQYAASYWATTSTLGSVVGYTGQLLTFQNGAAPQALSPGISGRVVHSGSTDAILCDSSTAIQDRETTVLYATNSAVTVTVPDTTTTGCGSNFAVVLAVSAANVSGTNFSASTTVTVNNTSTSKFYIANGSSTTSAATTFNLTTGQYATLNSIDNVNWYVRINTGAGSTATFAGLNTTGANGTNTNANPWAVAPGSALGGSTADFAVQGAASDTNTAAVFQVGTPSSSTQHVVYFNVQGDSAYQLNEVAAAGEQQQHVFGVCPATPSTSDPARMVECLVSTSATETRAFASSTAYTGKLVQAETETAPGTGFEYFSGRAGCGSAGDTCTETFNVLANGSANFGTTGQASAAVLTLYGSTTNSNLYPPSINLTNQAGSTGAWLYSSTTFNGQLGINSSLPTTDVAAGSVLYGPAGVNDVYTTGSASTTGLLQCFSGTTTVTNCVSNVLNFLGVAEATGNGNTRLKAYGLVTIQIPSSTTSAGDYICSGTLSGTSYNAVDNGSTQCPAGQQVGFATATNASPVTSVKVQLTSAGGVTGSSGGSSTGSGTLSSLGESIVLTGTSYAPAHGLYSSIIATQANAQAPLADASTAISNLAVNLSTALSGSQTLLVTLLDNGTGESVTCTVPNSGSTCVDATHSYNLPAGHQASWSMVLNTGSITTNVGIGAQAGVAAVTSITGTAPVNASASTGAITLSLSGAAGQVPNGTTGAFTATPTLGASGTLGSLTFGNATSGLLTLEPVTGALGTVQMNIPVPATSPGTLTQTVANGTAALGTSAISSGACATVVTVTATGTASTDTISWTPNASIKAVTGYAPATTGGLSIAAYPTSGNVNFDVCNWSSSSITPGAVTLNWRVTR